MPDEAIETWIDRVMRSSAVMEAYIDRQELDDSFGWGGILNTMWFSGGGKRLSGSGVLLTGPKGSGRHTAAYHMIKRLLERDYANIFLTADDLGVDAAKASERLRGLADRFYDQGIAMCVVLEEQEDCLFPVSVMRFLGETLCEYWICEDYPPLFVILISNRETAVPAPLRERLRLCRMSLPDEDGRRALAENAAKDLHNYVSFDALITLTGGMSYVQILDAVDGIRALVDQRDGALTREELARFLDTQRPPRKRQSANELFAEKLETLVDELPRLLGSIDVRQVPESKPTTEHQTVQTPTPAPTNDIDNERRRLEKLSVSELAAELFGEDRAKQLLNQTEPTIHRIMN